MTQSSRRSFLKGGLAAGFASAVPSASRGRSQESPGERVNLAVVGFNGRGRSHYRAFAAMENVRVAALCDVDERLFDRALREVEEIGGYRPTTVTDFRRLLDDKEIDAVSIASPDHWHALQTIWACQAGKDVYVEKPVSYCLWEGRKMVEAARNHDRVVQAGLNRRSDALDRRAIRYLHEGELGQVYRAKAFIFKGRASIGKLQDSAVPKGVHWDLFLGPAPNRPFNLNRFHYGWHFFWDTSTTDVGNSGVHEIDMARWGMNQRIHPVKIHCTGGVYAWDSDQETPNVQVGTLEYSDGTFLEIELTNLFTNPIGGMRETGNFFYTNKGYLSSAEGWETYFGEFRRRTPDVDEAGVWQGASNASFPRRVYKAGPLVKDLPDQEETVSHFQNFIDCVRSRKQQDLHCDIEEGHMSTSLCHLANISFRTGRKLTFNPETEQFVDDEEANSYLKRKYREPFVVPEQV